jgi:hypothetical protein
VCRLLTLNLGHPAGLIPVSHLKLTLRSVFAVVTVLAVWVACVAASHQESWNRSDWVMAYLAWGVIILSGVAVVYPRSEGSPIARWGLHSPAVLVAMYVVYERMVLSGMNIRADPAVVLPASGARLTCCVVRLFSLRSQARPYS